MEKKDQTNRKRAQRIVQLAQTIVELNKESGSVLLKPSYVVYFNQMQRMLHRRIERGDFNEGGAA